MLHNKRQQFLPLDSILDQVRVEDLIAHPPNLPIIIDQSAPLGTLPMLVDDPVQSVKSEENTRVRGSHEKSFGSTPKQGHTR